jgi:hypothetical protein
MYLPPWLPWFQSAARFRKGSRSTSEPLERLRSLGESSYADARDHPADRSYTAGGATDPVPVPRSGSRGQP